MMANNECYIRKLDNNNNNNKNRKNKWCATPCALPFTLKNILRQKEEFWKFKY